MTEVEPDTNKGASISSDIRMLEGVEDVVDNTKTPAPLSVPHKVDDFERDLKKIKDDKTPIVPAAKDDEDEDKEKKLETKSEEVDKEIDEVDEVELQPGITRPTVSAIKKEFPEFFKKFPEMKDVYFREQEYAKIYPTVDDAKTASERAQQMEIFEGSVGSGDPTLLIDTLEQVNPRALVDFSQNFLPILQSKSPKLHSQVVKPIIDHLIHAVVEEGERTKNDDLVNSARHITNLLYGRPDLPEIKPYKANLRPPDEAQAFQVKMMDNFKDDVESNMISTVKADISKEVDSLDLSDFIKRSLKDAIFEDLDEKLTNDESYQMYMKGLWKKSYDEIRAGKSPNGKPRLISALLGRARSILPAIKARRLGEVMPPTEPTVKPRPKSTATPVKSSGHKHYTKDELKGMSDMEILSMGTE